MSENIIYEKFEELVVDVLTDDEISKMRPFFDNLKERFESEVYQNFKFTELQKEAIKSRNFWKDHHNKLVMGSTSSGKTLVSELNMAYQIYCKDKQILYLVPLKALTTEKQDNFKLDFNGKRVYISSSDYQEQDYDLGRGQYDIGILVYEKFFALLAENSKGFLENCSLIVVDEMHMLSAQERGPKLEFSLEKVRFKKKKYASILGMMTSECDINRVQKWLGMENTSVICSEHRPIDIEERFVYCDSTMDTVQMRCFINGQEKTAPEFPVMLKYNEFDQQFFQLCQILEQHQTEYIIIFCNSKRRSVRIVNELCDSGVLKRCDNKAEDFPDIVDTDMEQSNYEVFRNHLEQYGIAYHNSSLTLVLREYIESKFRKGDIRIIVATETLTMGINTPADIMILYDRYVYRGNEIPEPMKYQDYKNAIGRTGRLGISKVNKGISYMLIGKEQSHLDKMVDYYVVRQEKLKVLSSITVSDDDNKNTLSMILAPFYLNLLNSGSFQNYDIEKLLENGLGDYKDDTLKLSEEIIKVLLGEYPNYVSNEMNSKRIHLPKLAQELLEYQELEDDESISYEIMDFGKKMSPFALSIGTYELINRLFVKLPKTEKAKMNRLPEYTLESPFSLDPEDVTNNNDKSVFFLDVMFIVCNLPEIQANKNYLSVPKTTTTYQQNAERREYIEKTILSFFKNKVKDNMLWKGSRLKHLCEKDEDAEIGEALTALYRTVVMYYWVQGYDVRDIRRELELPDREEFYIYTSEVESLGELCAYQLEAISKAVKNCDPSGETLPSINSELRRMFYALSIRIKYGMSNDLARIANKHIRGLNRARLLKIEKAAQSMRERYANVTDFILKNDECIKKLGVNDDQLKELRKILKSVLKYQEERLEDQVERTALVKAVFWDRFKTVKSMGNDSLHALADLFNNHLDIHFKCSEDSDSCCGEVRGANKSTELTIYLCSKREYTSSIEIINECGTADKKQDNILYVYKNGDLIDRNKVHNCMPVKEFCTLLLRSIVFNNSSDLGAAGDIFVEWLKKNIAGQEISNPQVLVNDLSTTDTNSIKTLNEEKIEKHPSVVINNVHNVQIINNNSISIQIGFNWIDTLRNLRKERNTIDVSSDNYIEEEQELYDKAALKISGALEEVPNMEFECRKIVENEGEHFDKMNEMIRDLPELKKIIHQAIYAKWLLSAHKEFEDYSPAAVLYGKSLEMFLYERLKPILIKKIPNYQMPGKTKLVKADKKKFTLGAYATILKNEFCENSKSEYDCFDSMNEDEKLFWKEFFNRIHRSTDIRNSASHQDNVISIKDISELHKLTMEIIGESDRLRKMDN